MAGNDGAAQLQCVAARFTRLAADGTTPAGATNSMTVTGMISLAGKTVVEAGDDFVQKNSAGQIMFAYKDVDHPKRIDATLMWTSPDPELAEMLTNGSLITANGQTIGYSVPMVGQNNPYGVCIETWSQAWISSNRAPGVQFSDASTTASSTTITSSSAAFSQADVGRTISGTGIPIGATITAVASYSTATLSVAATASATGVVITLGRPGQFIRNVFPMAKFIHSDFTISDSFRSMQLTGPMTENYAIGNGPFNDFPANMNTGRFQSWFRDTSVPAAAIGYATTPAQV